jgi:peptidoglycan/xylan/chitin deacetylase (PgdA/CDA1 family)
MTLKKVILTILCTVFLISAVSACGVKPSQTTASPTNNETATVSEPTQTPYVNENISIRMPILYYHAVNDTTFGLEQMFVRVQEFDDQMKYMKDHGYQCITFDDLPNIKNYEKPFIITFDDGYEDNFYNVYPILQKYDFKAVVYMVTDYIDKGSFLKTSQIKAMTDRISFESHTVSHELLSTLPADQIEYQLKNSKDILEKLTGQKVDSIAYPFGDYNDTVLELAAKYYRYGVLMGGGMYYHNGEDLLRMNRVYIPRGLDIESFKERIEAK